MTSVPPPSLLAQVFEDADTNVLKFSEQELNEILGIVDTRGLGDDPAIPRPPSQANLMGLQTQLGMQLETANLAAMHLQFQPHSPAPSPSDQGGQGTSASSMDNNYHTMDAFRAGSSDHTMQVSQILSGQDPTSQQATPFQGPCAASFAPSPVLSPGYQQPSTFQGFQFAVQGGQQQHFNHNFPQHESQSRNEQRQIVVSHSSVEKQRRDRINSLIDELRDLVPPQKGTMQYPPGTKSDGSVEARRPKHIVLADTISLLKQLKLSPQGSGVLLSPGASSAATVSPLKDEPEPRMEEVRVGEGVRLPDAAENIMPHIPVSLSSFAGVTVEKAGSKGQMYVQVKCRDRRGLLSDIINALKCLPLEIRTAAVVTCGDGMVRDVFEIKVDDPEMKPEDIQNIVHDGLYHKLTPRGSDGSGKKHRTFTS